MVFVMVRLGDAGVGDGGLPLGGGASSLRPSARQAARPGVGEAADVREVIRPLGFGASEDTRFQAPCGETPDPVHGPALENLREMMVRGILEPRAGHGIVGAVGSKALSRGQRQPSSGDLPEVPAEHELVQQRVGMPLVDEAFSPTPVGEFTASQGDPLEVERRTKDKPAGRALQVRHEGRLGQIPLGAAKLAAFPRCPGLR